MGFRFRRSVRLFPGVRLNFSATGISTTIGVRGASLTMGPRGTYANVGLPGTGFSYRERLSPSKPTRAAPTTIRFSRPRQERTHPIGLLIPRTPELPVRPTAVPETPGEIRSASSDEITSVSLKELRELLAEAWGESKRLNADIPAADAEVYRTQERARKWQNGILLKHVMKRKYATVLEELEEARSEREALSAEIEKCRVALEIQIHGVVETTYMSVVETFRALAGCEKCWDKTSEIEVNSPRERSKATKSVTRTAVILDMKAADVISPSRPAMHFQNANGGDLFILPGLVLVFGSHSDFGLVRLRELQVEYLPVRFLETEGVPADSNVVGETWAKVNKDGSPDRRFANNYQIPLVEYGELTFRSAGGINERFLFSSALNAQAFAKALEVHKDSLPLDLKAPNEEIIVTEPYSIRDAFRRHLDSEELSGLIRSIAARIGSGEFSRATFEQLLEIEGLSDTPSLQETLLDLVLVVVQQCVQDHKLSEVEIDELENLITIFRITEGDFYELRREAVRDVISAQAMWILGDQYVTEQEDVLQRDLQRLFGLSYDQYVGLLRPLAKQHIEKLESKKLATRDPEELTSIDSSIRNLRGVFLIDR